jgi:fatty acid/phospholipid biosynthesis enzyme
MTLKYSAFIGVSTVVIKMHGESNLKLIEET